jgi:hypothetical protein
MEMNKPMLHSEITLRVNNNFDNEGWAEARPSGER